jgi:hypothetical protein
MKNLNCPYCGQPVEDHQEATGILGRKAHKACREKESIGIAKDFEEMLK